MRNPTIDVRRTEVAPDLAILGAALVETDRRYFGLGAEQRQVAGAEIVWIDGMADLPAAGVVQRVVPAEIADPGDWTAEVTSALLELGFTHGRVYLDEPSDELEIELAAAGWTMRREPGLVAVDPVPSRGDGVELVPVVDVADWTAKEALHRADGLRPDGHDAPAARWVAMERARVGSGGLEAWLAIRDGIVCGTVCTLTVDGILRNKNIFVHPDHRRTGVGLGMLARLDDMARSRQTLMGSFSLAGEDSALLYRAAGMHTVVEQREWSRPLRRPS
jgi:GNAT superfamily N-acetyltransferase